MKNPFLNLPRRVDTRAITDTIERALAAAGLRGASQAEPVIDVQARVRPAQAAFDRLGGAEPEAPPTPGRMQRHRYGHGAGARDYLLYQPAQPPLSPAPLLVMLHGCTQSAEDFALGTQMNRAADAHGFLVVYPEQAAQANPSKCWNWFSPADQRGEAGEPALIAGIVREVAARHAVDPQRIFVAGLSAGGAMAVIMGETHPGLFAGVGVHSGLPYASAHDVASAVVAMKGGRGRPAAAPATRPAHSAVPTIVFHGDRDHTVQQSNAAAIVEQARMAHEHAAGGRPLVASVHTAQAPGGRRYTCTAYSGPDGQPRIASWVLHGAGHAWSGGDARGSYTDPKGPDASEQMLRFFAAIRPGHGQRA